MKILICVDDTDDLTKSISTGTIAEMIKDKIVSVGGIIEQGITRHQLLLHKDIEYTSHNSSMCFIADVPEQPIEQIRMMATEILLDKMAASADPGLCICNLAALQDPDSLVRYGLRAQREVLTKESAYALAKEVGGISLTEYGGSGIGVIGALAGVGLRLSGNDGTFRGKNGIGEKQITLSASELCQRLKADQVLDIEGTLLSMDTPVYIEEFAKLTLLNKKITVVVKKDKSGQYKVCKKSDLYDGDKKVGNWHIQCDLFTLDNDYEECRGESENACYNCLYRRWTANAFECAKGYDILELDS
ncbi:MAG: hypothetical protein ACOX7H_07950 [Bacillota bacterium]